MAFDSPRCRLVPAWHPQIADTLTVAPAARLVPRDFCCHIAAPKFFAAGGNLKTPGKRSWILSRCNAQGGDVCLSCRSQSRLADIRQGASVKLQTDHPRFVCIDVTVDVPFSSCDGTKLLLSATVIALLNRCMRNQKNMKAVGSMIEVATAVHPVTVEIAGLATAVPANRTTSQAGMAEWAERAFPEHSHLSHIYANAGVETRYFCEDPEWYLSAHSWRDRTEAYVRHAMPLLKEVAERALEAANMSAEEIDAVVTNTISGIIQPSLSARLLNMMDFREDVEQWPIYGYGCAGGIAGLARAHTIAKTQPDRNVLFLTIDLCTLYLRLTEPSVSMFIAGALFGDGAAGVVLCSRRSKHRQFEADQSISRQRIGNIVTAGDYFWRDSEQITKFDVKDDGYDLILSPELPTFIRNNLPCSLNHFLSSAGETGCQFDYYLIHPGGRKVLERMQHALELSTDDLRYSRSVLHDFGNMSSATVLFAMQRALEEGVSGRCLLAAVGPGFMASFMIVELDTHPNENAI